MHHFVVKFSEKKFRLRQQVGIDPPNQNPADVPVWIMTTASMRLKIEFKVKINGYG